MSRKCEICGKSTVFGNSVSHSHTKTKRNWKPNLIKIRAMINNSAKNIKICSRCLRSGKVEKVL